VWRGPMASRPNDSLNLIAEYYKFSNQVFSTTGVAMGNSVRPSKDMTALQADYNFVPAPGLVIAPFFEYFINPDMDGMVSSTRLKSASEVGGMLQIILPDLLGLPTLARVN
jgi:porin